MRRKVLAIAVETQCVPQFLKPVCQDHVRSNFIKEAKHKKPDTAVKAYRVSNVLYHPCLRLETRGVVR